MKNNIVVLSKEVKDQLDTPKNVEQIVGSINALVRSGGWKIIQSCLMGFREELIDQMKVLSGNDLIDGQKKLIAIDLMRTLPLDVLEEIKIFTSAMEKTGEAEFGYVEPGPSSVDNSPGKKGSRK